MLQRLIDDAPSPPAARGGSGGRYISKMFYETNHQCANYVII